MIAIFAKEFVQLVLQFIVVAMVANEIESTVDYLCVYLKLVAALQIVVELWAVSMLLVVVQ